MLMMALGRPHREEAAGGGGGLTGYLWTDSDSRTSGGGTISTISFTSFNIGTEQADRHVVIALGFQGAGGATVTVTINGVTATQIVMARDAGGVQEQSGIYIASVPTGTSVTVQVDFSGGASDRGIIANGYALYGMNATATATITDNNSDPATGSLSTALDGAAIGCVYIRSNSASPQDFSWGGLTEDGTDFYASASGGGGSASAIGTGSAISVSADFSGVPFRNPVLVAASFPKI